MGGRGASGLPEGIPSGGGGSSNLPWSKAPNFKSINTLKEAIGSKGKAMGIAQAAKGANPYYEGHSREFSENCQRAAVTYEARRRGYNVTAQPSFEGDRQGSAAYVNPRTGVRNSYFQGAFRKGKVENVSANRAKTAQKNLESSMLKHGDGSRAIMTFAWRKNGGHAINVENVKGKIKYIDAQTGERYSASKLFKAIKPDSVQIMRTDKLRFSERAKDTFEPARRRKKA